MTIVVRRRSIPSGSEAYQTESSVASAKRTFTLWNMNKTHLNQKSLWDRDNIINLFACVCLETIIFITIITIILGYYHNYWYHLQLFSLLNTNPYHWNIDNIYVSVNPSGSHNPWVAPRCKTRTEPRGLQRFATGAGAFPRPKREQKATQNRWDIIVVFLLFLRISLPISLFREKRWRESISLLPFVYWECCRFWPSHATPTCPSGNCLISGASEWRAICRWIAEYARSACYSYRHLCPGWWWFSDSIEVLEYCICPLFPTKAVI